MGFKIKNFYQKTSPLRQQKTSPLRQHEEGHEDDSGETIVRKTYHDGSWGTDGELRGTLWSDGTFVKSAYTLKLEDADGMTTEPVNEAMTPYMTDQEAEDAGITEGGEGFTDEGEGTVWVYDTRGKRVKKLSDEEQELATTKSRDQIDRQFSWGKALEPNKWVWDFDTGGYKLVEEKIAGAGASAGGGSGSAAGGASKVNWSEAPPLNTQERTQWYIDNNQGLDHTTPPLTVAETEPEPIEEVMTSSAPRARNNRRTRRGDRIRERNKKAELRRKGIKGNAKEGLIDGSFTIDDQDFQDPTVS